LRASVIGDDRRSVIEIAEVEAAAAILLHIQIIGRLSDPFPDGIAFSAGLLDRVGHGPALAQNLAGHVHGEAGHLLRDRQPLGFIGIQDRCIRPALQTGSKAPRQVGRVRDPGIHAVSRVGHPQMRGVTADEGASLAKPVGHQPSADPVFLAQDVVTEIGPDTEDGAD
jgi:hypothetical protein